MRNEEGTVERDLFYTQDAGLLHSVSGGGYTAHLLSARELRVPSGGLKTLLQLTLASECGKLHPRRHPILSPCSFTQAWKSIEGKAR